MAEGIKNLCAPIPAALHARVRAEQEKTGLALGVYITKLLTEYYENGEEKEEKSMEGMRTIAFQAPEELFLRMKRYLDRESQRTGKKLKQKDFILGLIQRALDEAEAAEETASEDDV